MTLKQWINGVTRAVEEGDTETLRELLSTTPVGDDAGDEEGAAKARSALALTPALRDASHMGSLGCVELLLAYGCDPFARDAFGASAQNFGANDPEMTEVTPDLYRRGVALLEACGAVAAAGLTPPFPREYAIRLRGKPPERIRANEMRMIHEQVDGLIRDAGCAPARACWQSPSSSTARLWLLPAEAEVLVPLIAACLDRSYTAALSIGPADESESGGVGVAN